MRGTTVDGFAYNFRAVVPHDAVYDRSQISHAVNLFDIASKYADVITTHDAIERLRALPGDQLLEAMAQTGSITAAATQLSHTVSGISRALDS